ncbi:MAG: glycosyltransferase [Planctomycetes bacterium]|nr:glycosyltransferase [Planctomycetota bacterium]
MKTDPHSIHPQDRVPQGVARDSRPTICQLVHTLNVGGAEILAREFALRSTADFRFVFACLDEVGEMGNQLQSLGYPVAVLQRRPGFDLRCIRRLARFCREQRVGLIHAHQYGPFFYAELASRLARGIPVLLTEHGRDYPDYRRPKRVFANRWLLRRRDRVVAVGENVREALVNFEGISRDRIEVVYNGINVESYAAPQPDRFAVRRELGLDDSHLVVLQVARLNRLKDHATAIRAMAQVASEFPAARLVLVGDGEERPALEALVATLRLQKMVLFTGMRIDVPRFLAAADVLLLTSISEGIPLTLLEAMAGSLPCVSTAVGGVPEVIVDGQTGLLAPAGDAAEIARQLGKLLSDADMRRRMGAAGRERAQAQFGDRTMHQSYHRIFNEMLGRPLPTAGTTPR